MQRLPLDDRVTGVIGIIFGLAFFWLSFSQVQATSQLVPGTGSFVLRGDFFPRVVASCFVLFGAGLTVSESIRQRREEMEPWPLLNTSGVAFRAALLFVAAVCAASLLLNIIGFPMTAALLAAPFSRVLGAPTWLHALGVAIGAGIVTHVTFVYLFSVPLPAYLT